MRGLVGVALALAILAGSEAFQPGTLSGSEHVPNSTVDEIKRVLRNLMSRLWEAISDPPAGSTP